MSNARRHYRVAQKEVAKEKENESAISIPEKYQNCVIAGLISLAILFFIKGLILGYHFGKNSDC